MAVTDLLAGQGHRHSPVLTSGHNNHDEQVVSPPVAPCESILANPLPGMSRHVQVAYVPLEVPLPTKESPGPCLKHGSPSSRELSSQMAPRSVYPFLHGSRS